MVVISGFYTCMVVIRFFSFNMSTTLCASLVTYILHDCGICASVFLKWQKMVFHLGINIIRNIETEIWFEKFDCKIVHELFVFGMHQYVPEMLYGPALLSFISIHAYL